MGTSKTVTVYFKHLDNSVCIRLTVKEGMYKYIVSDILSAMQTGKPLSIIDINDRTTIIAGDAIRMVH